MIKQSYILRRTFSSTVAIVDLKFPFEISSAETTRRCCSLFFPPQHVSKNKTKQRSWNVSEEISSSSYINSEVVSFSIPAKAHTSTQIKLFMLMTLVRNRNVLNAIFIDYSNEEIWETNQESSLYLKPRKRLQSKLWWKFQKNIHLIPK